MNSIRLRVVLLSNFMSFFEPWSPVAWPSRCAASDDALTRWKSWSRCVFVQNCESRISSSQSPTKRWKAFELISKTLEDEPSDA